MIGHPEIDQGVWGIGRSSALFTNSTESIAAPSWTRKLSISSFMGGGSSPHQSIVRLIASSICSIATSRYVFAIALLPLQALPAESRHVAGRSSADVRLVPFYAAKQSKRPIVVASTPSDRAAALSGSDEKQQSSERAPA